MKTNNKRKTAILAGAIVLALVMGLSTTFAWFAADDSVKNKLATKDALANVSIQETFVEPDDWKPGQTITKEVAVVDTGSAPALARITFEELLKVNLPPAGEPAAFNTTMETAGKRPVLFDNALYAGPDWFQVTVTPNAAKGGISLAGNYAPVQVWARYEAPSVGSGSSGSYSFAMWAPIGGTAYDGQLQSISYTRAWENADKVLTLSDIKYLTYQGEAEATADWTADKPLVADIGKSVAETKLNATAPTTGKYPNNLQLNYANVITAFSANPADDAGKWYYNAADGYFYYIGLAAPGAATSSMLQSLLLKNTADSEYYSNMTFELTVIMNAIQHTQDAVASWATGNAALNDVLNTFCES